MVLTASTLADTLQAAAEAHGKWECNNVVALVTAENEEPKVEFMSVPLELDVVDVLAMCREKRPLMIGLVAHGWATKTPPTHVPASQCADRRRVRVLAVLSNGGKDPVQSRLWFDDKPDECVKSDVLDGAVAEAMRFALGLPV